MRYIIYMLLLCSGWLIAACSSRQKSTKDEIHVLLPDTTLISTPQRMPPSDSQVTLHHKGKEYSSTIVRRPDDSLPIVENERGEKFVDNSITLRLTRGGKPVLDKTFTKESFASQVDAGFRRHAVLESMSYDGTTPQGIGYIATLCYPQADLCALLKVTVTADGKYSVRKEELPEEDIYSDDEKQLAGE